MCYSESRKEHLRIISKVCGCSFLPGIEKQRKDGKMMRQRTMEEWKGRLISFGLETLGGFLVAVALDCFAVNAAFPLTGFSGIALIVNRLWGLPIGATTVLLNIPLAFLCYKLLGRGFFLRSMRCMVISSIFIDYIGPMLPAYDGDRLLAALCTGVTMGVGYALIYMQNSSTGGADFVVMAMKAVRPHLSLGKLAFVTDVAIVLAGGFLFRDVDGIIYGMIVSFLFSAVIDKVMYGANAGKLALVVTTQGAKICQVIDDTCKRGSTILKAYGGWHQDDKQVVMCACSDKQMYGVQQAVKAADPASFMVVLESNEVHGEGFRYLQMGD